MDQINTSETTIKRISGYLHRVIPVADSTGKIISYALRPIMLEFKVRDVLQVMIGAALLAMPVCLTEEAWVLGEELPRRNVAGIAGLSLVLIGIFVYYNFYKITIKGYYLEFVKRVVGTYLISMLMVAIILTLLDKCPWGVDNNLAIKRIIIVSFPASLSGTLSDMIK
jgi:uncharacterized membrane protein